MAERLQKTVVLGSRTIMNLPPARHAGTPGAAIRPLRPWGHRRRYVLPVAAAVAALPVQLGLQVLTGPLPPFIVFFSAIAIINRNARAQAALVADVLDVSRITNGKLRLEPRRIDVAGVLEAAHARHIEISSELDDDLVLTADPDRLQQVLWNLLSNAAKFTPESGQVTVAGRRTPGGIELSVTDTGAGIAPEALPYLFQRFWQADRSPARRHGGLGLGLAIVRHLVELHGGEVRVESRGEGRGSRFTVSLPTAPPEPAPAEEEALPPAKVGPDQELATGD